MLVGRLSPAAYLLHHFVRLKRLNNRMMQSVNNVAPNRERVMPKLKKNILLGVFGDSQTAQASCKDVANVLSMGLMLMCSGNAGLREKRSNAGAEVPPTRGEKHLLDG